MNDLSEPPDMSTNYSQKLGALHPCNNLSQYRLAAQQFAPTPGRISPCLMVLVTSRLAPLFFMRNDGNGCAICPTFRSLLDTLFQIL